LRTSTCHRMTIAYIKKSIMQWLVSVKLCRDALLQGQ
jgi:hypothetical protein